MLVLGRNPGEKVFLQLGEVVIEVEVVDIDLNKVRLGFTAAKEVRIYRGEIWDVIQWDQWHEQLQEQRGATDAPATTPAPAVAPGDNRPVDP